MARNHSGEVVRVQKASAQPAPKGSRMRFGWRTRVALMIGVPFLVLVLVEAGLRIAGVGYSTSYFIPFPGGQELTTNPRFGWQFYPPEIATKPYPVRLNPQKQPGTKRIFVLGESAAQGTPAPGFGFARILEVMLREQFPTQRVEIVNAAMRGINSHAILPIARECVRYEPDLFVVYMGNNEFIGLHSPESDAFTLTPYPRLLRLVQTVKTMRLAQTAEWAVRRIAPGRMRREQNMDYFRQKRMAADDPKRAPVYANYQRNLAEMQRVMARAGIPGVVATVAVNLKDFPPLGSLHRRDLSAADLASWQAAFSQGTNAEARELPAEALRHYQAASRLDDHYAELHFRLAQCYAQEGQPEKAAQHYSLARDWDVLPFRVDSRLNQVVRNACGAASAGVHLVDVEKDLAAGASQACCPPGEELFNDHVHFSFDGDYQLARLMFPAVCRALRLEPLASGVTTNLLSRAACAERLAFTPWDEMSVKSAMVKSMSKPPFLDQVDHAGRQARADATVRRMTQDLREQGGGQKTLEMYRAALERSPRDWQILFNYGGLLNDFGDRPGAARILAQAVQEMPEFLPARMQLGQTLWNLGRRDEAIRQMTECFRFEPGYPPAREALDSAARKSSVTAKVR